MSKPDDYPVPVIIRRDVTLGDGRLLRAHDSAPAGKDGQDLADAFTVIWHHGTPQTGVPLEPLLSAAAARGIRLVSYGRPSCGGSSPLPGRDVASAASDVGRLADALGIGRFAVMGASGGGSHALACAALLPGRVSGVACLAALAPLSRDYDWFEGMASPGGLHAALDGRDARARYAETFEFDAGTFTASDWAALAHTWASLGEDAGRAGAEGPDGAVDDDVAYVAPWGFDPAEVDVPVLLAQGGEDRVVPPSHADWLLRTVPRAELWLRPRDGHISILDASFVAMDWLLASSD